MTVHTVYTWLLASLLSVMIQTALDPDTIALDYASIAWMILESLGWFIVLLPPLIFSRLMLKPVLRSSYSVTGKFALWMLFCVAGFLFEEVMSLLITGRDVISEIGTFLPVILSVCLAILIRWKQFISLLIELYA
jgi:hypothetical protein